MPAFVCDIEADNLLDDVTKIHCLGYSPVDRLEVKTLTTYSEIREFLFQDSLTIIGHNFVKYDKPTLEKILGEKFDFKIVDTLGLSYYLHSSDGRTKHGLEQYGDEYGVPKPPVYDWVNEPIEVYVNRVTEDVKINWRVWKDQQAYLSELYNRDNKEIFRLIDYVSFKYDCLKEQDENRIPVDLDLVASEIIRLEEMVVEKRVPLLAVMPDVVKYKEVLRPAKMVKADGSESEAAKKWGALLVRHGLDYDSTVEKLTVEASREPANPDSPLQVKDWLYKFGWIPKHIKYVRNKVTNEVKQIPQITSEEDKTQICESIVELAEEIPEVSYLAGYSTVKHRLNILKGFVRDMDKNLRLAGDAMGFTNTFRLKHRILVNLPKPDAPFAENIRACLLAGENHYMVGTDLSSAEDNTKMHYIFPFDPDYVAEMQSPDWEPHLSVAVKAELMSKEDSDFYKKVDRAEDKSVFSPEEIAKFKELKLVRAKGKTTNFSATYKVGAKTLSTRLKSTEKFAKKVLDAYWELNKSQKQFEQTCQTKTVRGQLWVKQPVSGFWYTLRAMKDIFSTVNQSTAVYVFDTWVKYMRQLGLVISFQAHDEAMLIVHNDVPKEEIKNKIQKAMDLTNKELHLNVTMKCSFDVGQNYKDVH